MGGSNTCRSDDRRETGQVWVIQKVVYLSFFTLYGSGMMARVETFTDPVAKMMTTVQRQTRRFE